MNLLFCLCLSLQPGGDRFLAEDKARHFVTSFMATTVTAGVARAFGADVRSAAWTGVVVGGTLGVGKELFDAGRPGGRASVGDLVWDAAGMGAGAAVMLQVR